MATNIKSVAYFLYENKLCDDTEKVFSAKVRSRGTVERKDLVDMIHERNTTVTRQEVAAVLEHLEEVVLSSIRMGYNVHTGIFNTSLSIRGLFSDMGDEFDAERHRLLLNVRPTRRVRKFVSEDLALEKTKPTRPVPLLFSLYDYASDSSDRLLTPGHVIDLTGSDFQFAPEDEAQGVYFVHNGSGERCRCARIKEWTAKRAVCLVPADLPAGGYTVQAVCGFGASLRTAVLENTVTVVGEAAN
ncbi:MAG: DUF4469 domain-containing protein [Spirochaetales bacterium]|nr:DUF4469 domain-containing protein [Spirochaetales bacterium]